MFKSEGAYADQIWSEGSQFIYESAFSRFSAQVDKSDIDLFIHMFFQICGKVQYAERDVDDLDRNIFMGLDE